MDSATAIWCPVSHPSCQDRRLDADEPKGNDDPLTTASA